MIFCIRYIYTTCHFRRLITWLQNVLHCRITAYYAVRNFLMVLKIPIHSSLDRFRGSRFSSRCKLHDNAKQIYKILFLQMAIVMVYMSSAISMCIRCIGRPIRYVYISLYFSNFKSLDIRSVWTLLLTLAVIVIIDFCKMNKVFMFYKQPIYRVSINQIRI